jgi:hypothetical protein
MSSSRLRRVVSSTLAGALVVAAGAIALPGNSAAVMAVPRAVDSSGQLDITITPAISATDPDTSKFVYTTGGGGLDGFVERIKNRDYNVTVDVTNCGTGENVQVVVLRSDGSAPVQGQSNTTCEPITVGPIDEGDYRLSVTRSNRSTSARVLTVPIRATTKVVFGFGESFAAGEGLEPYENAGCHSGPNSSQGSIARAASEQIEEPLAFIHLACSAATSTSFFQNQNPPYGGAAQPPQFAEYQRAIGLLGREADGVLLGTGGNDLPFLGFLVGCSFAFRTVGTATPLPDIPVFSAGQVCNETETSEAYVAYTNELDNRLNNQINTTAASFAGLATCLSGGGGSFTVYGNNGSATSIDQVATNVTCPITASLDRNKVVYVGYPTGFTGASGEWCSTFLFGANGSQWLEPRLIGRLDSAFGAAASSAGWRYVSTRNAFVNHGVCAGDQAWIYPIVDSIAGLAPGRSLHPNPAGAAEYARLAGPALAAALNEGSAPAPTTETFQRTLTADCSSSTITGEIVIGDAAVNAGRSLLVKLQSANGSPSDPGSSESITLQAGQTTYPFSLETFGSKPGEVAVYEADVSSATPILVLPCGAVDLAFVIDTTGSMFDDIDAVKAAANQLIANLAARNPDFRVAVVQYNDPGFGLVSNFSNDQATAVGAINSLGAGGGGDFPELVFSGISTAIDLQWRDDATRGIIVMGDAPPKDPEPGSGLTQAAVLELANSKRISVGPGAARAGFASSAAVLALPPDRVPAPGYLPLFSVLIGSDPSAAASFEALAAGSGGAVFRASAATEVVAALEEAILAATAPSDTEPPAIEIASPVAGSYGTNEVVPVTFTATDAPGPAAVVTTAVTLDGAPLDPASGIDTFGLTAGPHVLAVTATDPAGNSATTSVEFRVEATAASLHSAWHRAVAAGLVTNRGTSVSVSALLTAAERIAHIPRLNKVQSLLVLNAERLVAAGAARGRVDAAFATRFAGWSSDLRSRLDPPR